MPANKKTTELPRVLTTKPVSKISNIPRILPTRPVSTRSNIPRVLPTRPVSMVLPTGPVTMGKSGVRPQTPYDKTSRPYTNIRPETPYPRKEEARPEFSSNLRNERTQDLTYFLNEINKRGGKYSKNKVVKNSKRVVKANKK